MNGTTHYKPMKKIVLVVGLALGLFCSIDTLLAQTSDPNPKLSVADRMAKARAAKAAKKSDPPTGNSVKLIPTADKTPVGKVLKGPNGEVVHQGERGGKYYVNKNGNKTYLSSNQ